MASCITVFHLMRWDSSGAYLLPGFGFEIQLPAALGSCSLGANHGSEVRFNGFEI